MVLGANGPDSLIWWEWVREHQDEILAKLQEHIELTVTSVFLGLLIAAPLALLSIRRRWLYGPILSVGTVLYTIPSLAAFVLLIPFMERRTSAIVVLTSYTILILVRNAVTGLDAVPADVKEAAEGMGYSSTRQLLRVELPIALPTIIAGIRLAVVTVIGLVTVAAIVGEGGLGDLINDGLRRNFPTPLVVGASLSVLLAVLCDFALLAVQRIATPWQRKGR
ncbi:MAG: ABC transporter permease [Acidimicrobiia bacterium]